MGCGLGGVGNPYRYQAIWLSSKNYNTFNQQMIWNQYQLKCSNPYQVMRILKLNILYDKNSLCVQLFVANIDGLVQDCNTSISYTLQTLRRTLSHLYAKLC